MEQQEEQQVYPLKNLIAEQDEPFRTVDDILKFYGEQEDK